MNALTTILAAAALALPAAAQGAEAALVDELFAAAPLPPQDLCGATPAEKEAFRQQSREFLRRVDKEMQRLRREERKVRKGDEKRIRQEMAERYPEAAKADRKKMRGMSKEERLAMAQQMMSQQGAPPPMPAAPGAMAAKAQEQQGLSGKVAEREQAGRARLDAFLAAEPAASEAARARELGPLQAEYARIMSETIGSDEAERRNWTEAQRQAWAAREARDAETVRKYRAAAIRYCGALAPGWREALVAYRAAILAGRADYDALETNQTALAQGTGASVTPLQPGLAALEALHRYGQALEKDPYRFDLRPPER
ncbi:MAG: hypothetical protein HZB56_17170 [Deltaproteobacteria bacterium]|nr:hypothetical protein [Deltaproteobacteria bacterium]